MPVETLLRRFVVIRNNAEVAVETHGLDLLGEVDGILRAIVAHVSDGLAATVHGLEHGLEEPDLVIVEDGRALAGRGTHGDGVDSRLDEALGELLRAREVQVEILVKRRHARDDRAPEKRLCHARLLIISIRSNKVGVMQDYTGKGVG